MLFNILKIVLIFKLASAVLAAQQSEESNQLYEAVDDKWYHFSEEKLSWFDAEKKCRKLKGTLAAFLHDLEQQRLSKYMINKLPSESSLLDYWVGGTDRDAPGIFHWFNRGFDVKFVKWADGQPNSNDDNEHCLHLKHQKGEYLMNHGDCNQIANYICESDNPDINEEFEEEEEEEEQGESQEYTDTILDDAHDKAKKKLKKAAKKLASRYKNGLKKRRATGKLGYKSIPVIANKVEVGEAAEVVLDEAILAAALVGVCVF